MSPATSIPSVKDHPSFRALADRAERFTDFLNVADELLRARYAAEPPSLEELAGLMQRAQAAQSAILEMPMITGTALDAPVALALERFVRDLRAAELYPVTSAITRDPAMDQLPKRLLATLDQRIACFAETLRDMGALSEPMVEEFRLLVAGRGKIPHLRALPFDGRDQHGILVESSLFPPTGAMISSVARVSPSDVLPQILTRLGQLCSETPIDASSLSTLREVSVAARRLGVVTSADPHANMMLAVDEHTDVAALMASLPPAFAADKELERALMVLREIREDVVAAGARLDADLRYAIELAGREGPVAWLLGKAVKLSDWLHRREIATLREDLADWLVDISRHVIDKAGGKTRAELYDQASVQLATQLSAYLSETLRVTNPESLRSILEMMRESAAVRAFFTFQQKSAELESLLADAAGDDAELDPQSFPNHVRTLTALVPRIAEYKRLEALVIEQQRREAADEEDGAPRSEELQLLQSRIQRSRELLESYAKRVLTNLALWTSVELDASVVRAFEPYLRSVIEQTAGSAIQQSGLVADGVPQFDHITWSAAVRALESSAVEDAQARALLGFFQAAREKETSASPASVGRTFELHLYFKELRIEGLAGLEDQRERLGWTVSALRSILGEDALERYPASDTLALDDFSYALRVRLSAADAALVDSVEFRAGIAGVEQWLSKELSKALLAHARANLIELDESSQISVGVSLASLPA